LILLFLLAIAAVPGSILPQRGDQLRVSKFYAQHPTLAPIVDRLGGFNVFGSSWFAAIYLLLFISLAGCVIPRSRRHLTSIRALPPAAPRHLDRLPLSDLWITDVEPADAIAAAHDYLRSKRFRVHSSPSLLAAGAVDDQSVAAEKGYLREVGNLVFHLSLLVVLVGIAVTSAFGFTGNVLVKEHDGFADTQIAYDGLTPGRFVDVAKLPPFSFTLDSFEASYERSGTARGSASNFIAHVSWQPNLEAPPRVAAITVNHPLSTGGTNIYLGGHGYAPHLRVTDAAGNVFDQTTPFLPQAGGFEYPGVVKLPDAKPQQLGIRGIFLPTAALAPDGRPISVFPAPDAPALVVTAFAGDLGLDHGVPQSVYALDTSKMKALTGKLLLPGDTLTLPNGQGSVQFVGYDQWVSFQITHDPGKGVVLVAVGFAILGLLFSLRVRRRRIWLRAAPAASDRAGRTVVAVGGLTRTDARGGFDDEFAGLVKALQTKLPPVATGAEEEI
jgi:cytochrome c biogenesis protein